jgi:1,4-alpha-glucan branching enzyme
MIEIPFDNVCGRWTMGHKKTEKERAEGDVKREAGRKSQGHKEEKKGRKVELRYIDPDAKEVFVAGDFNGWDTTSHPMKRDKEGVWKAKLRLPPGRYEYKFFADGKWIHYVKGVERVPNPFGTENMVLWVD